MQDLALEADGLRLRTTRPEDISFVREAEAAPDNRGFVGRWSEAEHDACLRDGDCRHLLIEDPAEGEPVGFVLLQGLASSNLAMLLRRLVVARKGRGAGPRTVKAVARHCFDDCGFHRLWLDVREDNMTARRLYERHGFVVEGRARECLRVEGRWMSMLHMSILEHEYRALMEAASA